MPSPAPIEGAFRIDCRHAALAGHFPGHPIVPGVVLLDEILRIIDPHLPAGATAAGFDAVKFLAPVLPGQQVVVDGQLDPTGAGGATVTFSASVEAVPVLRGIASFAAAS